MLKWLFCCQDNANTEAWVSAQSDVMHAELVVLVQAFLKSIRHML